MIVYAPETFNTACIHDHFFGDFGENLAAVLIHTISISKLSFLGDFGENLDFKQRHHTTGILQSTRFLGDFGENLYMQK